MKYLKKIEELTQNKEFHSLSKNDRNTLFTIINKEKIKYIDLKDKIRSLQTAQYNLLGNIFSKYFNDWKSSEEELIFNIYKEFFDLKDRFTLNDNSIKTLFFNLLYHPKITDKNRLIFEKYFSSSLLSIYDFPIFPTDIKNTNILLKYNNIIDFFNNKDNFNLQQDFLTLIYRSPQIFKHFFNIYTNNLKQLPFTDFEETFKAQVFEATLNNNYDIEEINSIINYIYYDLIDERRDIFLMREYVNYSKKLFHLYTILKSKYPNESSYQTIIIYSLFFNFFRYFNYNLSKKREIFEDFINISNLFLSKHPELKETFIETILQFNKKKIHYFFFGFLLEICPFNELTDFYNSLSFSFMKNKNNTFSQTVQRSSFFNIDLVQDKTILNTILTEHQRQMHSNFLNHIKN